MKDTTPIYFHSATYAYEHGELDQYHASHKANIACREAIEQAITDNYRDTALNADVLLYRPALQQEAPPWRNVSKGFCGRPDFFQERG